MAAVCTDPYMIKEKANFHDDGTYIKKERYMPPSHGTSPGDSLLGKKGGTYLFEMLIVIA